ncbi:MAG: DUF3311 domain-containing protein [Gammaproteobacteria bacterium]|nr:DUF3311 domain-containing protein [Gammaproteobacteria bacterium]
MKLLRVALASLPFLALIPGVLFANRIEPFVLGLPFLFFWVIAWTVATSLIMAIVYKLDPHTHEPDEGQSGAD